MSKKKGKLIVFEGIDCCGKTTILQKLAYNRRFGTNTFFTREPGSLLPKEDTNKIEEIREEILHGYNNTDFQQAQLFAKARYLHTKQIIGYINNGSNIISDRYLLSSLIYQGLTLGQNIVKELNKDSINLLKEEKIDIHSIVFCITEETYKRRQQKRDTKLDAMEDKDDKIILDRLNTFNNIEEGKSQFGYIYKIDANTTIDEVFDQVVNIIEEILEK